ncbi:MAG: hypothetical protein NVS9B10_22270 [Nevskia sp.]
MSASSLMHLLLFFAYLGVLGLLVARMYGWRDRRATVPCKPRGCLRIRAGVAVKP